MKQLSGLLILAVIFTSCKNNSSTCSLTREDSLNICRLISQADTANKPATMKTDTLRKYMFKSDYKPKLIIGFDDARKLHQAYLKNPITSLVSKNGLIRGFVIEKADFDKVKAVATNGARIYFGFDDTSKEYHLILTGMGSSGENVFSAITDDFFPCPDHCPTNDETGTDTDRKMRYEHDFNYIQTIGNQVEYMNFFGSVQRIPYKN